MQSRYDHFKKTLQAINQYFSELYKEDEEKFRERYTSFLTIEKKIVNNKVDVNTVRDDCKVEAAQYRGKRGPQRYSKLLMDLSEACVVDQSEIQSATNDLVNAFIDNRIDILMNLKNETAETQIIIEKYLEGLEAEISGGKKEGNFFDRKIDVELSKTKKDIAVDIKDALEAFNSSNPDTKTLSNLIAIVIDSDYNNKIALSNNSGASNLSNRLGGHIMKLRNILSQHVPSEYDNGVIEGKERNGKFKLD